MSYNTFFTPEGTTLEAIWGLGASFVAVSAFYVDCTALFNCQDIYQTVYAKIGGKYAEISTSRDLKLSPALGACNFAMDAARSLNSVQAMKTETVQTRQLFGISECALAHWTRYFIMKIVQQGLYIHGKVGNKVTFQKFRPSCWRFREWLWKGTMKFNSVSLTNQIAFLDMFWWFDGRLKNILYFREFLISSLKQGKPACGNSFRARSARKSEREQKRGMKELSLSLIHLETFARQTKA